MMSEIELPRKADEMAGDEEIKEWLIETTENEDDFARCGAWLVFPVGDEKIVYKAEEVRE